MKAPREPDHIRLGEQQDVSALSVLVPVFNSEQSIGRLVDEVIAELAGRFERLELVLVDDGSSDNSYQCMLDAQERHPNQVTTVRLARNFGEHNAVMCGLHHVTGDAVAIIDDDFQNPPAEIASLIDELEKGHDVVYSCYSKKHHHWFRNLGSRFNDLVATLLLGKPPGLYLSSFKVMNRFLIDTVTAYEGPYPYLDGLILRSTSFVGTRLCSHHPREEGRSNYNFRRLVRLWLNMSTSFSFTPLRLSSYLGLVMAVLGVLLAAFFVVSWAVGGILHRGEIPPGWASLIVVTTFFFGVLFSLLGLLGEYVGRLYLTQNRHPQFVVRVSRRAEGGE